MHSRGDTSLNQCTTQGFVAWYLTKPVVTYHSNWIWGIFCKILSVPQNIVMNMNNVMKLSPTRHNLVSHNKPCMTVLKLYMIVLIGFANHPMWRTSKMLRFFFRSVYPLSSSHALMNHWSQNIVNLVKRTHTNESCCKSFGLHRSSSSSSSLQNTVNW